MELATEVTNEPEQLTNQLKFQTNPDGITDYQSQHPNEICHYLYLLMGIDKLHDFGEHFTKIYDLIYKYYFLYNNANKTLNILGQKIISSTDIVEQNLKNKVNSLHKLIDFLSYKTNLPITGAPILNFKIKDNRSEIMNINIKTPFTMASVKITDLDNEKKIANYLSHIPPERDVLLYFTGRKSHFKNTFGNDNILSNILNIPKTGEYVSKDAFPMSNDIINSIFKRDLTKNFQSYTSQLMDPASQTKDIVPVIKQIKTLFCVLTDNKKLFLNASLNNSQITLNFTLNNQTINGNPFKIGISTPTPSIQDVVIYLYYIEANKNKQLKSLKANYCAKIMNLFKTNKKRQNEIAENLKTNYFDKLINAVPNGANLTLEDLQLIAISSKTIGDQTYLWDSLIHDSSPAAERSAQGSFVATVDSFLFDQIVHGKNANAIFASKLNGGSIRDAVLGSNYQMVIYLKPSDPKVTEAIQAEQDLIRKELMSEYDILLDEFNAKLTETSIDTIINNFNDKRKFIVGMLVNMFNNIEPYDSSGRIPRIPKCYQLTIVENGENISQNDGSESKMEVVSEFREGAPTLYLTPINISNYYYDACYLLHFIIQSVISLLKVKIFIQQNEDIKVISDIQTLQSKLNLLKGTINTYDDALSYYNNTLNPLNKMIELYTYLKDNKVSDENITPDFEKVRNSLNQNKIRLEYYLDNKLPNTIGFSKCFFAIKDHVKDFFKGFENILFKDSVSSFHIGSKGKQSGGNIPSKEAFEKKIIDAFPTREYYNTNNNSNNIFNDCVIDPMDYYELFYLLKLIYYETSYDLIGDVFGKSTDDFYADLYTFIEKSLPDFYIFIQNNIICVELHQEILDIENNKPKRVKKQQSPQSTQIVQLTSPIASSPPSSPTASSRSTQSTPPTINPENRPAPVLGKRQRNKMSGGKKTKRKRKEKHNKTKRKRKEKHNKTKRKTKKKSKK